MSIKVLEADSKKAYKEFIQFPNTLYKDNEFFVPKLFKSQLNTLNPKTNPAYEFCDAKFWLAYKNGKIAGRIGGIINHQYNEKTGKKYIRFGWFDCINDADVSKALLDRVEEWGKEYSAEYIHGPLGFISFDASGVLVEGYNEMSTSFGSYNYPYYDDLLKKYGFNKDVDWIEYYLVCPDKVPEKLVKASKIITERYNLKNAEINNKRDVLKYADKLFEILNESYSEIYAFSELNQNMIDKLKKEFFTFINIDYISIIIDNNDKVCGFSIAFPSLAKALQKAKGRILPFGFIHIMKALLKNDTVELILIGVLPEYQNKGVHSLMFEKVIGNFIKNNVKHVQVTRSLETNNKLKNSWSLYENRQHKRARAYIKKLS